uniref:Putative extracellular protein CSOL_007b n=1 Tax=Pseudococcomyxa simplex TaxID=464287 RepID=A0A7L9QDL8_9CHLO|nr:putative extracellular protein CSOL_007b [Pseudococcomyxa simplex]
MTPFGALLAFLVTAVSGPLAAAEFSWTSVSNKDSTQHGDGTFYGQQDGQDAQGTCSYNENFANTVKLPWSSGTDMTLALNDAQFDNGSGCGLCIKFRGTGAGLGTTPPSTTEWKTGFVNNRCPECAFGDIDMNAKGDGRWKVEWYAVPCNVADSSLRYDIVVSSYYWFSLVVSNTRVPITAVEVKLGGEWLPLKRTVNNQWPYYNTNGPWQSSFPMPIRVTSVTGETIEDTITSAKGGDGSKQFSAVGGSGGSGNSTSYSASAPAPSSGSGNASSSGGSGSSPSPSSGSSSPAPASGPSSAPAKAPSSDSSASSDGKMYIMDYGQCGGNALECGKGSTTPCISAPWPTAVCKSSGWTCNRYDDGLYQCQPAKSQSGSSNTNYAAVSVGGRRLLSGN